MQHYKYRFSQNISVSKFIFPVHATKSVIKYVDYETKREESRSSEII